MCIKLPIGIMLIKNNILAYNQTDSGYAYLKKTEKESNLYKIEHSIGFFNINRRSMHLEVRLDLIVKHVPIGRVLQPNPIGTRC